MRIHVKYTSDERWWGDGIKLAAGLISFNRNRLKCRHPKKKTLVSGENWVFLSVD